MKYAFVNGVILDGSQEMAPRRGEVVLTDGENIRELVPAGGALSGYETIDLNGRYLMPGLINLHVHLPASGRPKKKAQDPVKTVRTMTSNPISRAVLRKLCEGFARTELFSGVTTIRTVGGILSDDTALRDRIASGAVAGPRILAADMPTPVSRTSMVQSSAPLGRALMLVIQETVPPS